VKLHKKDELGEVERETIRKKSKRGERL